MGLSYSCSRKYIGSLASKLKYKQGVLDDELLSMPDEMSLIGLLLKFKIISVNGNDVLVSRVSSGLVESDITYRIMATTMKRDKFKVGSNMLMEVENHIANVIIGHINNGQDDNYVLIDYGTAGDSIFR